MHTKKITTAAALAALAVPAAAFGHGGDDDKVRGDDRANAGQEQRAENRGRGHEARRGGDDHRGKHGGWSKGRRAFVIAGVDAAGVTVTDGKLAGPITLDPVLANRGAKKFLDLTKQELRGEDTVTFGTAGDDVRIRYVGLQSTDPLQPTDRVFVKGKLRRQEGSETKTLDIQKIVVLRKGAESDDD